MCNRFLKLTQRFIYFMQSFLFICFIFYFFGCDSNLFLKVDRRPPHILCLKSKQEVQLQHILFCCNDCTLHSLQASIHTIKYKSRITSYRNGYIHIDLIHLFDTNLIQKNLNYVVLLRYRQYIFSTVVDCYLINKW